MSDAFAAALPLPARSTGRNWIKANALAALISAAAGFTALLLGHALAANEVGAPVVAQVIVFLTFMLAPAASAGAYALVGRVLREKLPAFPLRAWIVLHVAFGLLVGLAAGYGAVQPPADTKNVAELLLSSSFMAGITVGGAFGGAIVGFVSGSVQVLVMRRAAHGAVAWIGFSILAGVLVAMVCAVALGMGHLASTMTDEVVTQAVGFISAMVAAVAMLPAVARLSPRTGDLTIL